MKKKISDIIPIDYKFNEDELIKDFKELKFDDFDSIIFSKKLNFRYI